MAMEGEGERKRRAASGELKCDQCGISFTYISNMRKHINNKHLHGPYPCNVCGRAYSTKTWLKKHTCEQVGKHRPLNCKECGRAFSKPESLVAHTAAHFLPSTLTCDVCNKYFTDRFALNRHLKTHLKTYKPMKEFVCEECGREYSQKGNLNLHIRCCHGSVPQVKTECVEGAGSIDAPPDPLQVHSTDARKNYKLANAVRRHECKQCGRRFTTRYILKNHLATHSMERPYECEVCGKTFTRKDCCRKHTKMHFTPREVICDHCGKGFSDKANVRQHMLMHLPKQHRCEACGKEFTHKTSLLSHLRINVHNCKKNL